MPKVEKVPMSHLTSVSTLSAAGNGTRSSLWSAKDDELLVDARARGLKWDQIAPKFFPTRSPNSLRKRYECLMERHESSQPWVQWIERENRGIYERRRTERGDSTVQPGPNYAPFETRNPHDQALQFKALRKSMPNRADGLIHLRPRISQFSPALIQKSEVYSQDATNKLSADVPSRKWPPSPDPRHDTQDRSPSLHQPQLNLTEYPCLFEFSTFHGSPARSLEGDAALRGTMSPNKPDNFRPMHIPGHSKILQNSAVAEDTPVPNLPKPGHAARHLVDQTTPNPNGATNIPIGGETVWHCDKCGDGPIKLMQTSCQMCGHQTCGNCPYETVRAHQNPSNLPEIHDSPDEKWSPESYGINKERSKSPTMPDHVTPPAQSSDKGNPIAVDHASSPEQLSAGAPEQADQSRPTISLRNLHWRPSQAHTSNESATLYINYTISQDHTTETTSRKTAMFAAIQDRCRLYPSKSNVASRLRQRKDIFFNLLD